MERERERERNNKKTHQEKVSKRHKNIKGKKRIYSLTKSECQKHKFRKKFMLEKTERKVCEIAVKEVPTR